MRRYLEQTSGPTAVAAQPAAQCVPSDIGTLAVTEPNQIDKASFGRIQPKREAVASIDFLATEVKGFSCKNVNIDRRTQRRCPASTGNGDINSGWDDVRQFMTGQGRGQAEGAARGVRYAISRRF
jgi:hypothetical protein